MDFEKTGVFDAQTEDFEQEPQDDAALSLSASGVSSQVNNYNSNLDDSLARLSTSFAAKENYLRDANIEDALATDPVKFGKAKRIAERRGEDVDLVFNNFEEFEAKDKQLLLNDIVKKNPALKELAVDSPEFMKLAANDCDKLQEISNNLTIFGTMDKPIKPVAMAKTATYLYNENERRLGLYEEIGDLMTKTDAESQARLAVLVDEANKASLVDTSSFADFGYNFVEQLPYMKRTMLPKVAATFTGAAIDAAVSAKIGAASGGAAGSVVPGAGTAAGATIGGIGGAITGTIKGATIGNVAGTGIAMKNTYDVETGSMYANLAVMKDENGQGFERGDMITVSRAYGALSAAVELLPMETLARVIPGYNEAKKGMLKAGFKKAVQEALKNKTKTEAIRSILKNITFAAGAEGFEESVQELLQVVGERHLQDKYNNQLGYHFEKNAWEDDTARIGEAGYQGFKASLLFPVLGGAGRAYTETHAINEIKAIDSLQRGDAAKTELDVARLDNIHNTIQKTGELKENPAQLQAFLQRAVRKSDMRDIYMTVEDAKAVLQSEAVKKNMDVMKKLGVLDSIQRQIANSAETGSPIKIAFEDYGATVMSRQELYGAFKDIVKTYEDGLTMNELRAHQRTIESVVKEGQKLKEQNQADFDYIYQRILENARVAGIPSDQAKMAAEQNTFFYLGLARMHSLSAVQMFQQDGLNFDYKIENAPARSAQLDKIIDVIRDEQIKGADQNLLRASRIVARKDINAIKKTLMSKIDAPNTADVKEYLRLLNAISDMKINLEGMTNEDFSAQLRAYAAQQPVTADIKRSDSDRIKSGLFSASEKALADIQDKGATGDYVLVGGGRVPVNYEIVELADLVTSHNSEGAINEAYPQDLQPRDRSRTASDAQINEIVNSFAPERVAKAPTAAEGAPIVTQDGIVAVGNGRAMAISKVYENAEKAEQYRQYLTDLGYDAENFAEPVLVRRLAVDLDTEQLRALVDDANTSGTMQYSDAEKAIAYSKKLTGEIIDLLDTDAALSSAANRRFIHEFFAKVVPTAERNAFLDKDDKVIRKGIEMIENTLTAIIVPDARFLSVLVENPDNNIRKVTSGLAKSAPAIVAFENDVQNGIIDAKYSVAADIRQAVEVLKRAKDKGQSLDLYVKQLDLLEGHLPAEVLALADLFDKSSSAVDFADKIKSYIHNATEQGDLAQGNMFGTEPISKIDLLERMNVQSGLFQLPAEAYNKQGKADINSEAFKRWFGDSKVVDENGRPLVVYHGTKSIFNTFDKAKRGQAADVAKVGFWFSPSEQFGRNFAKDLWYGEDEVTVMPVYLSLKKPKIYKSGTIEESIKAEKKSAFDKARNELKEATTKRNELKETQGWGAASEYMQSVNYEGLKESFELAQAELYAVQKTDAYEKFKMDVYRAGGQNATQFDMVLNPKATEKYVNQLKEQGYDGIIIEDTKYDAQNITNAKTDTQYVVFESNQIKSVNNRGTFDPNNNNIYYQTGKNDRDLVVQHATTLEKLSAALELGAMPMPSLAVTKSEYAGDSNFGEIVFIGGSDVIDPEKNRDNHTFPADIYSTRKISPVHEINEDGRDYLERLTGAMSKKGLHYWIENVKQNLDMGNDATLKELFLASKSKITDLDGSTYMLVVNMSEQEKTDFAKWKRKFITEYTDKKIFEGFTPSGNRKFSPYDLNNILRLMKKESLKSSESTADGNAHALRGVWAEELKSIEEIRQAKDKIVDAETYKKLDNVIWDETTELSDLLVTEKKAEELERSWVAPDEYMIEEVLKKLKSTSNIKTVLEKAELRSDKKAVDAVKKYMMLLKATPVQYFESKPQRAVDFSEFAGVIMPTSREYDSMADTMAKYGLHIVRSDNQQAAVKEFEKVFFQQQEAEALGSFTPSTLTVTLFKNHNLSTIIHESGHFWREMIRRYAAMDGASEQLKVYSETLEKWLDSEWGKHNEVVVQPDGTYTLFYNGQPLQQGFATREAAVEVAKHECFARGVEKYFLTAAAPSFKLRNVFAAFKRWLTGVYKDAKELDVDLTPEVKDVFDRLLASDGEIEQYILEKRIRKMFETPEKAKMSQKQFDRYKEYMDNMLTIAKDDYYKSLAALAFKEKTAEFKNKTIELRQDVLMQFSENPENRFIIALVYGKIGDTEVDIKANSAEIKAVFNAVVANGADRLPKRLDGKAIFANDGMSFKDLSHFFGLDIEVIKRTLSQSPKLITAIEDTLRYQVHEKLGSPVSYAEVEAQIVKSLHNDKYFDMLSLELSKLSPNPEKQGAMEHALQARAEDIIGGLRITEIKPERYFNQSLKAGDNAITALNRNNRNAAYTYKRQQLMNFFLYKEAQKQLDFVDKSVRRLKEIGKKEVNLSVNQQHQDAARAILSRFELAKVLTQKQKERLGNLSRWIDEQRAAGYDINVPTSILEAVDKKPYTELTVDELASLNDLVKNIIHNGREIKTYELAGQLLEKEKLLNQFEEQIKKSYAPIVQKKSGKQPKHELQDFGNTVDENLITLGGLCNRIDNGNANGVMHTAFLRPLADAQNLENDLLRKFGSRMNELNNSLSEETKAALFENVPGSKDALGAEYTLGELISIGLNMGNYYNKQRMRSNFGDNEQFDAKMGWVARTLTKEHWDYIQNVWDLLDSMYPMLSEHQKKMSGLDMDKVIATQVSTPYGDYRGGYYPIVYDKTASMEARDKNNAETALLESDYGRATTAKGYTKSRLDRVNAPLKFGLAPISQHIASVIHDVAYRQTIRQLWNLANSPSFMETFDKYLESEYRDGLCQLLKTIANQPNRDARAMKKLDSYLRIIRNRTTTIGLAYRVTTAVAQFLGFFSSVAVMSQRGRKNGGKRGGAYWLLRGIKSFAQSAENRKWALANSGELRNRLNNNDVNIAEAMRGVANEISKKQKINDVVVKGGFWLIGKMDFIVAQSTWFAAYNQAINDLKYEHKDAVFYADRIMIDSQGSGNLKDTPLFQRGGELSRSLAMFYSPFAGLYQIWTQSVKDIRDKREFAGALSDLFTMLILPPLVEGILKGDTPGADDDAEEWIKYFLLNPLFYWMSTIPIARDAASVMDFGRVPGSLYANAFNTVYQPVKKLYKLAAGKDVKGSSFVKDLMNAIAMTTGVPVGGQVADWTSYFSGVATGEIEAESPADILYGIYRGKERK